MQGSLRATHTRELAVELLWDREEKAWVREQTNNKGVPKILVTNLTYLLCLAQVT